MNDNNTPDSTGRTGGQAASGCSSQAPKREGTQRFLSPNLGRAGRWVRGLGGVGLLVGGWAGLQVHWGLGVGLMVSGVFVLYEALRGWCLLRACGVKTRI